MRTQNQTGNHPKNGMKLENSFRLANTINVIRIDGSVRITTINQQFSQKYTPFYPPAHKRTNQEDLRHLPSSRPSWPITLAPLLSTGRLIIVNILPKITMPSTVDVPSTSTPPAILTQPFETHQQRSYGKTPTMASPIPKLQLESPPKPSLPKLSPIRLQCSTRIKWPPGWQTSDDYCFGDNYHLSTSFKSFDKDLGGGGGGGDRK